MERIPTTGTKIHHNNPKLVFTITNNALYTNLASEIFACTFLSSGLCDV